MSKPPALNEAPWRAGLAGARANLGPGLILQVAALALVLAYYRHDGLRAELTRLTEFRAEVGWAFSVVSTGFFGGLLPFLWLRGRAAMRAERPRYTWRQGAALTAFWAYKGIEVDLFYRFLARTFGEGVDVPTIAMKMTVDQFIYCPLFAVPATVLVYAWVESHFQTATVIADVRGIQWYRRRAFPVLISNLGVWVPAVCIIFALPTPLQLPLQNLVLCFFTLLLAHLAGENPKK